MSEFVVAVLAFLSMMHDEPQPACGSVEYNCTQRAGADYYRPEEEDFDKRPVWVGPEHFSCSINSRSQTAPLPGAAASRPDSGTIKWRYRLPPRSRSR